MAEGSRRAAEHAQSRVREVRMTEDEAEIARGQVTRMCGTVDRIWLSYRKGPKMLHGLEQRKDTTDHEKRAAAGRPVMRLLQESE